MQELLFTIRDIFIKKLKLVNLFTLLILLLTLSSCRKWPQGIYNAGFGTRTEYFTNVDCSTNDHLIFQIYEDGSSILISEGKSILASEMGLCGEKEVDMTRYEFNGAAVKWETGSSGIVEYSMCNDVFNASGTVHFEIVNGEVILYGKVNCINQGIMLTSLHLSPGQ